MDMHIDKARCNDETCCIKYGCAFCRQIFPDSHNFSISNQNIANFILLQCRIYYSAAFNE